MGRLENCANSWASSAEGAGAAKPSISCCLPGPSGYASCGAGISGVADDSGVVFVDRFRFLGAGSATIFSAVIGCASALYCALEVCCGACVVCAVGCGVGDCDCDAC